jgi:hypothetical protein
VAHQTLSSPAKQNMHDSDTNNVLSSAKLLSELGAVTACQQQLPGERFGCMERLISAGSNMQNLE